MKKPLYPVLIHSQLLRKNRYPNGTPQKNTLKKTNEENDGFNLITSVMCISKKVGKTIKNGMVKFLKFIFCSSNVLRHDFAISFDDILWRKKCNILQILLPFSQSAKKNQEVIILNKFSLKKAQFVLNSSTVNYFNWDDNITVV